MDRRRKIRFTTKVHGERKEEQWRSIRSRITSKVRRYNRKTSTRFTCMSGAVCLHRGSSTGAGNLSWERSQVVPTLLELQNRHNVSSSSSFHPSQRKSRDRERKCLSLGSIMSECRQVQHTQGKPSPGTTTKGVEVRYFLCKFLSALLLVDER